jgi:WD40 repeat protein
MPAGYWLAASSLALSPDGKTLAAGTVCGPIAWTGGFAQDHQGLFFLWDVASGKLLHQCQGDQGSSLAFSRDGHVLASVRGDNENPTRVRLWEVSTGRELRPLSVDCPGIYHVVFSPSSDRLVAVGRNSIIFILDSITGNVLHRLVGHCNVIHGVALSRDGQTLASIEAGRPGGDPEDYVRLWSVASGKLLQRLGHQSFIQAIAFGADGMLAAFDNDGIHLWDSQSGKQLRHFSGPPPSSTGSLSLAFSPDGKTLACGDGDGVISFWDVETGTLARPMPRHQMGVNSVAVSPDGRTVATASSDRSIGLWDVASAKQLQTLSHKDSVQSVAFSPDGKHLASASYDDGAAAVVDTIALWDPAKGEIVQRFKGRCLAFSPDGKLLACGGSDDQNPQGPWSGFIRLHDVETGKLIRLLQGHKARVQKLAFSPDGKTLASASLNFFGALFGENVPAELATVRLWDVASGRERCQVDASSLNPSILTFSPDGRLLLTLGENSHSSSQLRIWEVVTGKKRRVLDLKKSESVTSVIWMPDGRTLAVGNSQDAIGFFDLATGQELGRVGGHCGAVNSLALSPDTKTLFSGSADTTALVWDLPSVFTPTRRALEPLPRGGVTPLWADLESADAAKADQAIWTLVRAGNEAAAYLDGRLKPAKDDPLKGIPQLLADLDNDKFAVREAASRELEELLPEAEARLGTALRTNPSAEVGRRLADLLERNKGKVTAPELLRRLRALEVLEHIATAEARDVLEKLAAGAPEARLTQEAKVAVDRLAKRATAKP